MPWRCDALHAVIEEARQQHVAQADLQLRRLEVRIPGTDRAVILAQHAHHLDRQVLDLARRRGDVGRGTAPGGRDLHVAEIGLLPRAGPAGTGRASATVGS